MDTTNLTLVTQENLHEIGDFFGLYSGNDPEPMLWAGYPDIHPRIRPGMVIQWDEDRIRLWTPLTQEIPRSDIQNGNPSWKRFNSRQVMTAKRP